VPKPRADLQYVAYRIDAAIRVGRVAAVPIYPLTDDLQNLDRWPSSVLNLESFRRRMPPLYVDTREKYEAKFERPWDNRSTIPPCVFNSRFVAVTTRSPDYDWLLQASLEERRAVQVIETSRGLRRRIYEIIEDLSHARRQPVHIRAQYEREIANLQQMRLQLKERLRQERSGILTLTHQEVEIASLMSAQIAQRITEVERILQDRVVREVGLRSYAQQSNLQLFFLAQSLANFSGSLKRAALFNRYAVERYLQDFVSDLSMFGSREVRRDRNYAKLLLERVISNIVRIEQNETARLLEKAVEHLTRAAVVMTHWSDSLDESELNIANLGKRIVGH